MLGKNLLSQAPFSLSTDIQAKYIIGLTPPLKYRSQITA